MRRRREAPARHPAGRRGHPRAGRRARRHRAPARAPAGRRPGGVRRSSPSGRGCARRTAALTARAVAAAPPRQPGRPGRRRGPDRSAAPRPAAASAPGPRSPWWSAEDLRPTSPRGQPGGAPRGHDRGLGRPRDHSSADSGRPRARTRGLVAGVVAADVALARGALRAELARRAWMPAAGGRGSRGRAKPWPWPTGRAESPLESLGRVRFHEQGLPAPELQVVLGDADGVIGRVDHYWAQHRTVAEADGALKYVERAALFEEKRREDRLREAGFEVVRYTWAEALRLPELVAARLRRAFARVGAAPSRLTARTGPQPPTSPVFAVRAHRRQRAYAEPWGSAGRGGPGGPGESGGRGRGGGAGRVRGGRGGRPRGCRWGSRRAGRRRAPAASAGPGTPPPRSASRWRCPRGSRRPG